MSRVEYKDLNVLEAARARMELVFDRFERIVVSVSSGKDSTVLFDLALAEARKRGRKLSVFFLDQEAEYAASLEIIDRMMSTPDVTPLWYQVPILMTNAASHRELFLYAWEPGAEWMRPKDERAIHEAAGAPDRFYPFFEWFEGAQAPPAAILVGLRSKESLNRFRAVTRNPGFEDVSWSTETNADGVYRFYPIYDWTAGDVWKYIADSNLPYNRVYDWQLAKRGVNISRMRVSNLIHEKSFRCLVDLQEFEPETFDRLVKRLGGVHAAAIYADEPLGFAASELPSRFTSWREYRDYLVQTTPSEYMDRFIRRFDRQSDDETTARDQVRQLLTNDWEGSLQVRSRISRKVEETWRERLSLD